VSGKDNEMGRNTATNHRERIVRLALVFLAILQAGAKADLFGFGAISNNSGVSAGMAKQLSVEVSSYDTDQVLFQFRNDLAPFMVEAPLSGRIAAVFFDDSGTLEGIAGLIEAPPEVDFYYPLNGNGNFPEGNILTPAFSTTPGFSAGKSSAAAAGIDPGEYLGIVFDLQEGRGFADVIDAIDLGATTGGEGSLRIGLHVTNLGADGRDSDSFVVVPVPIPGAVLLGSLGMGTAGFFLRRRKALTALRAPAGD